MPRSVLAQTHASAARGMGGRVSDPILIRLVRTSASVIDLGQGCPDVARDGVGDSDGLAVGLDGDRAVAAGGVGAASGAAPIGQGTSRERCGYSSMTHTPPAGSSRRACAR
jgi:hypothetical protein